MKEFVGPQIARIFADSEMLKVLETDPQDQFTFLISTNPNLRQSAKSADNSALDHARFLSRAMVALSVLVVAAAIARAGNPPGVSSVTSNQRTSDAPLVDVHNHLTNGGSSVSLGGGFPGDLDGDGDVDLFDYALFVGCVTGPNMGPVSPSCGPADFDLDHDVDLLDWRAFQRRFGLFDLHAGMVLIPAGEYLMGDHFNEGDSGEHPVHAVYIDEFYMDKHEVTNQQYADALNWALAHGGLISVVDGRVLRFGGTSVAYCRITTSSPLISRITWNGSTFGVVAGKKIHPMVRVSWYGAAAYSNWRSEMQGLQPSYDTTTWACDFNASGYRLPTEAEWEKAARGGLHSPYRRYPWGDTITGANANYFGSGDSYEEQWPETTRVGYYNGSQTPAGPDMANGYGLYDMAGNAWEWCNDWYGSTYYGSSPYNNPAGPASGSFRVLRGGSWRHSADYLRSALRDYSSPGNWFDYYGFRLFVD